MTPQHDADGVPAQGTQPTDPPRSTAAPRHSRALLALVAAGTVAVAPIAVTAIGLADNGGAHSAPAYALAEASHDIGRNDWAAQSNFAGFVSWIATYVALALAWLAVTLWMRTRERRTPTKLWFRTALATLATELTAGVLTIGAVLYAQWTATSLGPVALRLADVCSPWWSCVAALVVVGRVERNAVALRAALGYGAVLTLLLLVPLPGPDLVKTLVLAVTVAVPALLVPRRSDAPLSRLLRPRRFRSDAAAAG